MGINMIPQPGDISAPQFIDGHGLRRRTSVYSPIATEVLAMNSLSRSISRAAAECQKDGQDVAFIDGQGLRRRSTVIAAPPGACGKLPVANRRHTTTGLSVIKERNLVDRAFPEASSKSVPSYSSSMHHQDQSHHVPMLQRADKAAVSAGTRHGLRCSSLVTVNDNEVFVGRDGEMSLRQSPTVEFISNSNARHQDSLSSFTVASSAAKNSHQSRPNQAYRSANSTPSDSLDGFLSTQTKNKATRECVVTGSYDSLMAYKKAGSSDGRPAPSSNIDAAGSRRSPTFVRSSVAMQSSLLRTTPDQRRSSHLLPPLSGSIPAVSVTNEIAVGTLFSPSAPPETKAKHGRRSPAFIVQSPRVSTDSSVVSSRPATVTYLQSKKNAPDASNNQYLQTHFEQDMSRLTRRTGSIRMS